jgi:hypothetical protein
MNLKNVSLTKVIHFCVISGVYAIYMNDIDQNIVKKLLYSKHNCKLGMKNVKIGKIDQHKNAMCQMQSLERTLTLYFVVVLTYITHPTHI